MLQRAIDAATVWQSWTLLVFFVDITRCCGSAADTWQDLKLPDEHIPYFFKNNIHLRTLCEIDPNCPHKVRYPHIPVLSNFYRLVIRAGVNSGVNLDLENKLLEIEALACCTHNVIYFVV